jgi:predicted nucleic acid-binding protein
MTADGRTAAISVITLGELRAGVRLAGDPTLQAVRQARLSAIRKAFEPIMVDELVAERYGDILAAARSQGRTIKATDLLHRHRRGDWACPAHSRRRSGRISPSRRCAG